MIRWGNVTFLYELVLFALFIELNVRQSLHGIFPIGNATVFGSLKFPLTNIKIFFHSTFIIYQEMETFVETFAFFKKKPETVYRNGHRRVSVYHTEHDRY